MYQDVGHFKDYMLAYMIYPRYNVKSAPEEIYDVIFVLNWKQLSLIISPTIVCGTIPNSIVNSSLE